MQTKPPLKLNLLIFGAFIVTALPTLLFFFAPLFLLQLTSLSYFFLIFAIFLTLSRFGKLRFKNTNTTQTPLPFLSWLTIIFSAELLLTLLYFSFAHTVLTYIPYNFLTANVTHELIWRWGLHPWPLIAVLSCCLAFSYYCEQKPPILSSLIPVLRDTYLDTVIRRFFQIILNITTHFSIAATLSFGAVQLAKMLTQAIGFTPIYALNLTTLLFGFIIVAFFNSKSIQPGIKFLCRKQFSLGAFSLLIVLMLALFFTFQNIAAPFLNNFFPLHIKNSPASEAIWEIAVWGWWISWALFFSSLIAKISYGKSLRSVIIGVLFLPVMFAMIAPHVNSIHFSAMQLDWLALTGPIIIIAILRSTQDANYFTLGFMPNDTDNEFAKPRRLIKFISSFILTIVMTSLLYLWLGLTMLSLVIMLGVLVCFIFFLLGSLLFYGRLFQSVY